MVQIQEVTPDATDNSGPIFDAEPLQKVTNNGNYNVFAFENEHPKQPGSVIYIYLEEQGDTNITIDSLDMCDNRDTVDQDDYDLAKERGNGYVKSGQNRSKTDKTGHGIRKSAKKSKPKANLS
nr:hypothetical protein [Tanacetum cinerariifolium]